MQTQVSEQLNEINQLIFICTVCDAENDLEQSTEINEIVECMDCATEFEVISLEPIQVVELELSDEDWGQ